MSANLMQKQDVDRFLDVLDGLSPQEWRAVHQRFEVVPEHEWSKVTACVLDAVLERERATNAPKAAEAKRMAEVDRIAARLDAIIARLPARLNGDAESGSKLRFAAGKYTVAMRMREQLLKTPKGRRTIELLETLFVTAGAISTGPVSQRGRTANGAAGERAQRPTSRPAQASSSVTPQECCALWRDIRVAVRRRGGTVPLFRAGPPASENAIATVEAKLGLKLPQSFREFMRTVASRVHLEWKLGHIAEIVGEGPDSKPGFPPPEYGELSWSLRQLPRLEKARQQWADIYPDTRRRDGKAWRNKLAFQKASNGDLLAIDVSSGHVVYLDHDAGKLHGCTLAPSFAEFVSRFSLLGCPGPEWWVLEPFLAKDGLGPNGRVGRVWRTWIGL